MAEIAGLVLGGIPIAIWALEKYAEPFNAFHHYRTSIETFRTNLILQNWQLQTTLSNIGLGSDPSINQLRECFETQFPEISRELMFIVQRMDEVTAGLLKNLDIDINGKPNALPDKVRWEWSRVRHSFSAKKRNKLVEGLRHWNEDLRRSLEKPEVPARDDSRKVQELKRRFNIERCNSIRQCFTSLHRVLESTFCSTCSPPHEAAIDLDWETYESNPAKIVKLAVFYATNSKVTQETGSWRKLRVTSDTSSETVDSAPDLLAPSSPAGCPSPILSLRSKMARLISRTPSPSAIRLATTTAITPLPSESQALAAVTTSASTKITGFCTALCTGCNALSGSEILQDPDENQNRQFFVDHNQADLPKIVMEVPLKFIVSSHEKRSQQREPYLSLSAKQRYGIAASIAWSVLHLGGSPWFGDHWDEKQAGIFLEETQSGRVVLSQHPCASYIFSPPAVREELTTNDFEHLIPNRTVFALGILLIELCINKSFTEIRQVSEASLLDDYQTALSNLDEVYRLAGDSYGYATERCVKLSFQCQDLYKNFCFSQFRQQFHDAVVAPVQATYLMFPDSHNPR